VNNEESRIEKAPIVRFAKGALHPGVRPYLVPTRGWGVVVDTARASNVSRTL